MGSDFLDREPLPPQDHRIADTRVGIGTTLPKARLDVATGDILIGAPGAGIILKSPNGALCRKLTVDNAGALVTTAIACP